MNNRSLPIKFLVIGNPENRRVSFFQAALARVELHPATIISYQDLLSSNISLSDCLTPSTVVRIESPGENFVVEKLLIALGAESAAANAAQDQCDLISNQAAQLLEFDKGRISFIRQWYYGFRAAMQMISTDLQSCHHLHYMNRPNDIEIMFDKPRCYQLLQENKTPLPRSLGVIHNFDELFERMRQQRCWRVFIKLAHGSSASGVVAYQTNIREHKAVTTVEMVRSNSEIKLYNSLRVREYRDWQDIRDLIDTLARHYIWVEEWLPKARFDDKSFDLRIMMIDDKAMHTVMRTSHTPITNLHLLNKRGDLVKLKETIKPEHWQAMEQTCEKVMRNFSSHYAGIDLLVMPNLRKHAILEVNAFGDLLPNLYYDGMDTYTSEVKTFIDKLANN